jgi:hypothetical protein
MKARYIFIAVITLSSLMYAGGPLVVGGPAFGVDGQAFTWNPAAMPIQYRVDPGPMATSPSGVVVIDNASGLTRLQSMFSVWQSVPTAAVSFSNAGAILATGSYAGGDVTTASQFNDIFGSCKTGAQNPVIFDANGSLVKALGLPPEVIGFNNPCALDPATGFVKGSMIVMNGQFQDGVDSPTSNNFELTANEFDEAITHEMGHFLGLDHSQINLDLLINFAGGSCDVDSLAGMPLMFPISFCQARKDAGLPVLSPDDVSWISSLYPTASQATSYATISGVVFFPDGLSHFQSANVIARRVDDPATPEDESRRIAVSVVSGYLFTANPGQSVTAVLGGTEDNTNGDPNGSRKPGLIGFYQVKVPPGTYTIEVEEIFNGFNGGSSVGPLGIAATVSPNKFWNKNSSRVDFPLQRDTITVHAGDNVTDINVILNGAPARFDQYEDSGALIYPPLVPAAMKEEGARA